MSSDTEARIDAEALSNDLYRITVESDNEAIPVKVEVTVREVTLRSFKEKLQRLLETEE